MRFRELLETVGDLPVFRSSLLLAGARDPADVRRQLVRWKNTGKILQLRRNVYVLATPWRRVDPHPFLIANEVHAPSYVSLQSALAYHGLIPEAVPVTVSVTTGRPGTFDTPLGRYLYRHIHPDAFFGYQRLRVFEDQEARVADAEKALLDLVHLTRSGESIEHLESLRLEGLETVSPQVLHAQARRWGKGKLERAAANIVDMRAPTSAGGAHRER